MNSHHDHMQDAHSGMGTNCNGLPNPRGGTWQGHVLPGIIFIIWGSWWVYNTCIRYIWRTPQRQFQSRSFYSFPVSFVAFVEPCLKIILPPIAVSIELYFDHSDGYQYLYCPKGTMYAGRFAAENFNNWQHAASYPAIFLSGIIDLISAQIDLPPGTNNAFLALAFAIMSFLMGTHEKHEAQDRVMHWLLFISMLMCTLFIVLEMYIPRNPLPSFARAVSVLLLGSWMIQIAVAEFEHHPQWSSEYNGGAMMAPTVFCMILVLIIACISCLYIVLYYVHRLNVVGVSQLIAVDDDDDDDNVDGGFVKKKDRKCGFYDGTSVELTERKYLMGGGDDERGIESNLSFENDSAHSHDGSPIIISNTNRYHHHNSHNSHSSGSDGNGGVIVGAGLDAYNHQHIV